MQFPSCAAFLRIAFFGSLCALSVVNALPAGISSSSESKPGSLLGHAYNSRAENPPILPHFRPSTVELRTQQPDGHGPLGRADRFKIAQRHLASTSSMNDAVDERSATRDVEARENLLSHEELPAAPVPNPVDPTAILPATTTSTTMTTTTTMSDASQNTPGARLAEKHDKSKKKTGSTKNKASHDSHKGKKTHFSSAE